MFTDYDCWHPGHDAVTVQDILGHLAANGQNAQRVIAEAVRHMPAERKCKCGSALKSALLTDRKAIPEATKQTLKLLVGNYL